VCDVLDREEVKKLMGAYDVGVVALPDRKSSYSLMQSAVEAGFSMVDILEEYHRRPDAYETEGLEVPEGMSLDDYGDWLHETAIKANITIVDGMGFAPGLSNVTLADAIRKLDKAESAVARVGGIPSWEASQNHPLRYMISWAFEHVLREYMVRLEVIRKGKVVEVDAMTDLEKFRFTEWGQDVDLECAVTPGMPSFIHTRPELGEFSEKTIRWPGHWAGIETLKDIGLLDLDPIEFQGNLISPREFMLALMKPKLSPLPGETDICVMWNTVKGLMEGKNVRIDHYMWDEADSENGISAMGRVTGFSEAICARFLAEGRIKPTGLVAPEDCIAGDLYEAFIAELADREIQILEVINSKPVAHE
jgi:saccharopine dehydrogenase-like NADP-dependent oxidoreductase